MILSSQTKTNLIWTLLGLAIGVVVWLHAAVLAPFALSLVLAYGLRPAVASLERRRLPRSLAVTLCLLLVILVLAVLLVLLVPIVSELAPMLREQLPDLIGRLWRGLLPWLGQWGFNVPTSVEALKTEAMHLLQTNFKQWSGALFQSVLIGGSGLMTFAGFAVLVPVLAFYWLMDWDRLAAKGHTLIPVRWRPALADLGHECDDLMGQYLRGQVIVMLILAVYYSVGLALFGFKLALPIGVLTGLAVFIPYLGFGLGLILAILAGLLQFGLADQGVGYPLLAVAVVYGSGQVVESFFLTPRLVGERIGLHPIGVILALMLFGQWMGLAGILIALPTTALLMVLGRRLLRSYQTSRFYLTDAGPGQG